MRFLEVASLSRDETIRQQTTRPPLRQFHTFLLARRRIDRKRPNMMLLVIRLCTLPDLTVLQYHQFMVRL